MMSAISPASTSGLKYSINGLEIQEGKPYEEPYGLQVPVDEVEIRPLTVYENLAGVV